MDTQSEKLLVEALQLINTTSTEAWWAHHSSHCGSDYNAFTCHTCYANDQCARHEALIGIFSVLIPAVG